MKDNVILCCKECGSRKIETRCLGCEKAFDFAEKLTKAIAIVTDFENVEEVMLKLKSLPNRELEIVARRIGIGKSQTLDQIASELHMTKATIREIEVSSFKKINSILQQYKVEK